MIHHRSGTPEGHELKMCECTEHLGLVDGALHHRCFTLNLVCEETSLVDDGIEILIKTLNHTMVGVEAVFVEFLHLTIVTTLTTAAPYIVGEEVLREEPVIICRLRLQIERSCTRVYILVGGIVGVHATHIAMLLDVELAFAADSHQRHHPQQCDIQYILFHNSFLFSLFTFLPFYLY